jgi:hypothetical protein
MTITTSTTRPTPIRRERETCRVPFGFSPVTAATATMTTAMPSHTSQSTSVHPTNAAPSAVASTSDEERVGNPWGQSFDPFRASGGSRENALPGRALMWALQSLASRSALAAPVGATDGTPGVRALVLAPREGPANRVSRASYRTSARAGINARSAARVAQLNCEGLTPGIARAGAARGCVAIRAAEVILNFS